LKKHRKDSYYEPFLGKHAEYIKILKDKEILGRNSRSVHSKASKSVRSGDSVRKQLSRRKGFDYVFKNGLVTERERFSPTFKHDGENSFRHKKKSNVRISTRKQRFFKPPEVATDFYHQHQSVFKNFEDFDLDKHVVVEGCYDTNKHVLAQQVDCRNFNDTVTPNEESYYILKDSIRDTIRKLRIKEIGDVNISDIDDFDFDLSTKPGFRYEHYLKANIKSDCTEVAVAVAKERYRAVVKATNEGRFIRRDEIIPGIYTIGARNKREENAEDGEVATSRAIHMPEWHTELHAGIFSDLITTQIVEFERGPIYIGNSFTRFERFEQEMNKSCVAIEGDWKKFDASLCNNLVTMSLCVLRLYFPPGLLYDNHFLSILDSLVIKDYHTVGGNVLRILHGLPSGSKLTSLIGSVINLIVLNYCFSSVKYFDRSFAIGGDDFVTFIRSFNYDLESLEKVVYEKSSCIGMNLKFFKIKNYKNSNDIQDYPVFYKYTVFQGKPVIPLENLLERVFSPWNKRYSTTSRVLSFLDDILPSLAYPSSACVLFYLYYQYVYYRACGDIYPLQKLILRHYVCYNRLKGINDVVYDIKNVYQKNKRNVFIMGVSLSKFERICFNLPT
jgi:hypothetical protein